MGFDPCLALQHLNHGVGLRQAEHLPPLVSGDLRQCRNKRCLARPSHTLDHHNTIVAGQRHDAGAQLLLIERSRTGLLLEADGDLICGEHDRRAATPGIEPFEQAPLLRDMLGCRDMGGGPIGAAHTAKDQQALVRESLDPRLDLLDGHA